MKTNKILYWVTTGLICALMLYSAIGMYLMKTDMVKGFFEALGYPSYIVVPLAIAKILAVITLLTRFNKTLVEWAYAGLFFDFVLAAAAHLMVKDGEHMAAVVAILLLLASRFFYGKVFK